MKFKSFIFSATVVSIALSGTALAKKTVGKGNPHHGGPDARWENSNRQSDEFSQRGRDRAEERHYSKESKKYKQKKEKKLKHKKDKYHDNHRYDRKYNWRDDEVDGRYEKKHDRYERQRYEERYRNNPIDTVIDRNVNNAKSKIDEVYRKTIDTIDNKSNEIIAVEPRREKTKQPQRWWWPFPE